MDLSSAIENFSEFFVAANTRTSLTDFAESTSNSLDPTSSHQHHHHNSLSNMNAQSISTTSSNNHHLNLSSFDDQPSSNHSSPGGGGSIRKQLNEHTGSMHQMPSNSSSTGISKSDLANHFRDHHNHHHHHHHHLDSADNCNDNNSTTNHSNEPSRQMMINGHPRDSSSSSSYVKYHRKYRKSELYQAQSTSPTRLSQPMRAQIPIHCIIEQFDHYTPISTYNYQPPLNDNDLFRTEDPMDPANSHTSHQQLTHNNSGSSGGGGLSQINSNNHNSNHNNQPHLHQSKLALESVTNGSSANISLSTNNNNNNNNNNSLFSNNTATSSSHPDTSIFEQIDANLDQLRSDSPLSLGPSNPLDVALGNDLQPSGSILGDDPININPDPYLSNNQQLSSSKETYVIVGSNTLFVDVLPVVLRNLGYSSLEIISAKATIQMKNWKAIPLDQVTDDKKATVGEIFGDISSFATLRIVLVNSNSVSQVPMEWNETMIRQVVLALTQTMSQLTLSKLCNISQPLISAIVRGGKRLGRRKCMEFGQWYMNYVKSNEVARGPSGLGGMSGLGGGGSGGGSLGHSEGSGRLVFDKRREIPRLKSWFAENAKPSEELLQQYSRLMNDDPIRRDRPQVSAKALKNWWKNERQKLGIRQREFRGRPKLKQIDSGGGGGGGGGGDS